jgi:hypothetical protein
MAAAVILILSPGRDRGIGSLTENPAPGICVREIRRSAADSWRKSRQSELKLSQILSRCA